MAGGHACLEGYSPSYACIVYRPIVTLSVKVAQSPAFRWGEKLVLEAGNSLWMGPPHNLRWAPLESISIRPLQDEERKYDAVG